MLSLVRVRRTEPPPRAAEGSPPRREPRRVLPWVLSVVLHAAVLAWWASLPEPPPKERVTEADLRPIELVELPEVVEVPEPEVQPEPAPTEPPEPEVQPEPGTEPLPPDARTPTPRRPDASRAGDPAGDPTTPTEPATDEPTGGVSLLGLRSGSRSASAGTSLRPSLPAPAAIGHGRVVREVAGASTAGEVRRDGSPRSLAEAGFRTRRNGTMVFRDHTGRFTATLRPDGRLKFRDMPVAVQRDPMTGAARGLAMPGLAEGLRAASGQELYHQEKRRLLEETFELRLALAVAFAKDKVDRRLKSLYRELLALWHDEGTSEAERREALFRRWDECEEGLAVALPGFDGAATSELDALRRSAGEQARETIERFVRRQLPVGSPQAYPDEELRRLNAGRHSRARFEPYR